jgi:hypothetical protein
MDALSNNLELTEPGAELADIDGARNDPAPTIDFDLRAHIVNKTHACELAIEAFQRLDSMHPIEYYERVPVNDDRGLE